MDHLIFLLETYKYWILLPLAIIEGPLLAIIVGFLITLSIFNPLIAFFILVLGDVIGDMLMYLLGRWGGKPILSKFGRFLGVTEQKLNDARVFFSDRHTKAVVLSKLIHGVGFVGLITAGILRVSYRKFALTCLSLSIAQVTLMLILGVLFGHAYTLLGNYLGYYATGVSIAAVLIVIVIIFLKIKNR